MAECALAEPARFVGLRVSQLPPRLIDALADVEIGEDTLEAHSEALVYDTLRFLAAPEGRDIKIEYHEDPALHDLREHRHRAHYALAARDAAVTAVHHFGL